MKKNENHKVFFDMCAKLREHLLVCLWHHFKTLQSRQAETQGNCANGTGRNICMKRKKERKEYL